MQVDQSRFALVWYFSFHWSTLASTICSSKLAFSLLLRFSIPSDAEGLMDRVRSDLGFSKKSRAFPDSKVCSKIYSFKVNSRKSLKHTLTGQYHEWREWLPQLKKLFAAYDKEKRRQNVVDFDDLLAFWLRLMTDKKIGGENQRHVRSCPG